MARLTIRPLSPRDVRLIRGVHQYYETVSTPRHGCSAYSVTDLVRTSVVTGSPGGIRMYVALVEGELCAHLVVRPDRERFCWDVLALAAGSPHLSAHESEAIELWGSLLEFTIVQAGEAGAKRLFADAADDSVAHAALVGAGFEGFTTRRILADAARVGSTSDMSGIRALDPSDVWSVHNLYHRITPRLVQFAEARTSAYWELDRRSRLGRLPFRAREPISFVRESQNGIEAFFRMSEFGNYRWIELLIDPASRVDTGEFVRACVRLACLSDDTQLRVAVAGFAIECASRLEVAGFSQIGEDVALVRHTTAAAAVHTRLAPLPLTDTAERAIRGVPSYSVAARGDGSSGAARQAPESM